MWRSRILYDRRSTGFNWRGPRVPGTHDRQPISGLSHNPMDFYLLLSFSAARNRTNHTKIAAFRLRAISLEENRPDKWRGLRIASRILWSTTINWASTMPSRPLQSRNCERKREGGLRKTDNSRCFGWSLDRSKDCIHVMKSIDPVEIATNKHASRKIRVAFHPLIWGRVPSNTRKIQPVIWRKTDEFRVNSSTDKQPVISGRR